MFRRFVSLALASVLMFQSAACLAAEADGPVATPAPELLARQSSGVTVERSSDENPVMEVARATFWGAAAGSVVGLAVAAMQNDNPSAALRWGFAMGTFTGLATGTYWVMQRPAPASFLELRDGRFVPSAAALESIQVAPDGWRVRAVGVTF